jgi:hypothetical protein
VLKTAEAEPDAIQADRGDHAVAAQKAGSDGDPMDTLYLSGTTPQMRTDAAAKTTSQEGQQPAEARLVSQSC